MVSKEERSDGTDNIDVFDKIKTNKIVGSVASATPGATGRPFSFETVVTGKMGGFFNCSKSYIDLSATGSVTGLLSAHNMELRMPVTSPGSSGSYTCAEHELVFQAGAVSVPTTFAWFQVTAGSQAVIDAWEDRADCAAMIFKGLTSGAGSIYDATQGPAGANASLKIIIGTTPYWIMLSTTAS